MGDGEKEERSYLKYTVPVILTSSVIDHDIGANCIQNVDGLCSTQFPWTRGEGVGLGGQRSDRANVDNIAREFAGKHLLDVSADLEVVAPPSRSQLLNARDLVTESNATRALQ